MKNIRTEPIAQQVCIERVGSPQSYYQEHAEELEIAGAAAFGQPVDTFGVQVAERFCKAAFAQVMHCDGQIAGFALHDKLPSRYGAILSIEGRAIRPEFQGLGLGTLALHEILQTDKDIEAAASVTRNPAVLRVMRKGFCVVSPDLEAASPLHHVESNEKVRELSQIYSQHVGADPANTPFVDNRYEGGLYGGNDPGRGMTALPHIANNPANGVVMVAVERKRTV